MKFNKKTVRRILLKANADTKHSLKEGEQFTPFLNEGNLIKILREVRKLDRKRGEVKGYEISNCIQRWGEQFKNSDPAGSYHVCNLSKKGWLLTRSRSPFAAYLQYAIQKYAAKD